MSRSLAVVFGSILVAGVFPTLTHAQTPDPASCFWDLLLGCSPVNAHPNLNVAYRYRFTGFLRDPGGLPVANYPASQLQLDLNGRHPENRLIQADRNSNDVGLVVWQDNLAFGGVSPEPIPVLVGGQVFAILPGHVGSHSGPESPPCDIDGGVRSVDVDADGIIGLVDLGFLRREYFNRGIRLDFIGDMAPVGGPPRVNFDGCTDIIDLGWLQAHYQAQ